MDAIGGVHLGMYLCHAYFARGHGWEGSSEPIMLVLNKVRLDTIFMEYASPGAGRVQLLEIFPENARLGFGYIDYYDPNVETSKRRNVETSEQVVERIKVAMQYVDKNRMPLHSDCGFAPSIQNPIDID